MATSTPAFLLNAISIDSDSVFTIEDEAIKQVFKKIEVSGLRKFLSASFQEIYSFELLSIYKKSSVSDDEKIQLLVFGHSLVVDDEFFANLLQLPNVGISSFSDVSALDVEEMQVNLSASGQLIKVYDLLVDIATTLTTFKVVYKV